LALRVVSIFSWQHASISSPLSCGADRGHLPYLAVRFALPSLSDGAPLPLRQRGSSSPPLSSGAPLPLRWHGSSPPPLFCGTVRAPLPSPVAYLSTDPLSSGAFLRSQFPSLVRQRNPTRPLHLTPLLALSFDPLCSPGRAFLGLDIAYKNTLILVY
jgi:hypothetical protein